jgi:hypothetical protein
VRPFVHLLGGVRHDHVRIESNTSWGGFAGGGIDVRAAERVAIRLAADFQIFDEDEKPRTLRLAVGVTF